MHADDVASIRSWSVEIVLIGNDSNFFVRAIALYARLTDFLMMVTCNWRGARQPDALPTAMCISTIVNAL